MQKILSLSLLLLTSLSLQAQSIKDFEPFEYEVRFTNPVCDVYRYDTPVVAVGGSSLSQKPKNAYCRNNDEAKNLGRQGTPSEKYLDWINDPANKEIFLSYLSFSNDAARDALCEAMEKRGVKVSMVLDQTTGLTDANKLEECGGQLFTLHLRGHVPGLDYAHIKLMLLNPTSDAGPFQAVFGSGNLSSGLTMHHENWHFLKTSRQTYFAKSHLCLMEGQLHHFKSGGEFKKFMRGCLAKIQTPVEKDLQPFFVPGQGDDAFESIKNAMADSSNILMAAHRLSFPALIDALSQKLQKDRGFQLKLVVDDDIYWVNRPNSPYEKNVLRRLQENGVKVKFIETNDRHRFLHHNKFMIFEGRDVPAVFTGAGNFTGTAFRVNWENFYFITIPEVVKAMQEQFKHLYDDLATPESQLPEQEAHPSTI